MLHLKIIKPLNDFDIDCFFTNIVIYIPKSMHPRIYRQIICNKNILHKKTVDYVRPPFVQTSVKNI